VTGNDVPLAAQNAFGASFVRTYWKALSALHAGFEEEVRRA